MNTYEININFINTLIITHILNKISMTKIIKDDLQYNSSNAFPQPQILIIRHVVEKIGILLVIFWSELANKLGVIAMDKLYPLIGLNLVMEQLKDNKVGDNLHNIQIGINELILCIKGRSILYR
jgi:hypothetical protein